MRGLTETELRWDPAPDLLWTHYPDSDDWVVFHPQSGDVSLVSASAHLLWMLIADGRADCLTDLVAALARELARDPDPELMSVTRETLSYMDRAGLVRPKTV